MVGLVKIGPWGGRGGDPRDIVAAGVTPLRLENIVIRGEGAVDSISFTYAGVDGVPRKAGPWGGSGGRKYKVCRSTTVLPSQAMSRRTHHLAVLHFTSSLHTARCYALFIHARLMSENEISS